MMLIRSQVCFFQLRNLNRALDHMQLHVYVRSIDPCHELKRKPGKELVTNACDPYSRLPSYR
jgi:hypothetical protein